MLSYVNFFGLGLSSLLFGRPFFLSFFGWYNHTSVCLYSHSVLLLSRFSKYFFYVGQGKSKGSVWMDNFTECLLYEYEYVCNYFTMVPLYICKFHSLTYLCLCDLLFTVRFAAASYKLLNYPRRIRSSRKPALSFNNCRGILLYYLTFQLRLWVSNISQNQWMNTYTSIIRFNLQFLSS